MKICITLDDVIRNKSKQIGKIVKKYLKPDIDLDTISFETDNYETIFGFESKKEYNRFLYTDYFFEIFAEAEMCDKMLDKKLNLWHLGLEDEVGDVELMLSNPFEWNNSIGATHFFLSKMATRIRETYFPLNSLDIWDKCDILITANPKLLENKPQGKISIKIETDYNKGCDSDFTYASLTEFIEDYNPIKKIIGADEV